MASSPSNKEHSATFLPTAQLDEGLQTAFQLQHVQLSSRSPSYNFNSPLKSSKNYIKLIWKGKHESCAACDRQPQHICDGFVRDKEQFVFFKEPKEHFLPWTVL